MNLSANNASSKNSWDNHYKRDKSILKYPDENLVRLISKYLSSKNHSIENKIALDLGCGTGRHINLLNEKGFKKVIGLDMSQMALSTCKSLYSANYIQAFNSDIPLKNNSIDLIISWGGLHYTDKENFKVQINEINRVLKTGGTFLGTLRSSRDTMLKKGKEISNNTWITNLNDIENSIVSFYNEEEIKSYFNKFKSIEYGLIERTILNSPESLISHWYFYISK